MKVVRAILLGLIAQDVFGAAAGMALRSPQTAGLFGIAAVSAFATLCAAEWFDGLRNGSPPEAAK